MDQLSRKPCGPRLRPLVGDPLQQQFSGEGAHFPCRLDDRCYPGDAYGVRGVEPYNRDLLPRREPKLHKSANGKHGGLIAEAEEGSRRFREFLGSDWARRDTHKRLIEIPVFSEERRQRNEEFRYLPQVIDLLCVLEAAQPLTVDVALEVDGYHGYLVMPKRNKTLNFAKETGRTRWTR